LGENPPPCRSQAAQRVSGGSHYSPPNGTGRENLRRKGGRSRGRVGDGEMGSCLGGERLLNALVLHGGGPAEASATDGDLRLRRRGAGGVGGGHPLADEVWECGERERGEIKGSDEVS